jgi:hypothetical protein
MASLFFKINLRGMDRIKIPITFLAVMVVLTLPVCAQQTRQADSATIMRGGRIMPPSTLACERNQLTSWTGAVTEYQRKTGSTRMVIHTDYDTVETAVVLHVNSDDPSGSFMIFGQPFEPGDWHRIESGYGVLIEDMRATAWVCDSPDIGIIIDWRPGDSSINSSQARSRN